MNRCRTAHAVLLALALAACGESEPAPPVKRTSMNDVTNAVARLFEKPKPKSVPQPAAQLPPYVEPEPAPAPVLLPMPQPRPESAPPVVAPPVELPPAAVTAKPKPKPQWAKKKPAPRGCENGIAGYSRKRIRMAGSASIVVAMAEARGHVVTPAARARIEDCFK